VVERGVARLQGAVLLLQLLQTALQLLELVRLVRDLVAGLRQALLEAAAAVLAGAEPLGGLLQLLVLVAQPQTQPCIRSARRLTSAPA